MGGVVRTVGVAHVPSPRQKVDEEAEVPELRFVTGRLPVTSDPSATVPAPERTPVVDRTSPLERPDTVRPVNVGLDEVAML